MPRPPTYSRLAASIQRGSLAEKLGSNSASEGAINEKYSAGLACGLRLDTSSQCPAKQLLATGKLRLSKEKMEATVQ